MYIIYMYSGTANEDCSSSTHNHKHIFSPRGPETGDYSSPQRVMGLLDVKREM